VKTFAIFGPALLVSVELFDPASIVTATASGATFGFGIEFLYNQRLALTLACEKRDWI